MDRPFRLAGAALPAAVLLLGLTLLSPTWGGERPRAEAGAVLAEVVERVEATCRSVQDLSARFVQTATNRSLGQVQEARGQFLLKRPGKMRWEYQKPDEYLIVTDGRTLWLYRPLDREARAQEVEQAFTSRTPISFLAGDCDLRREFEVSLVEHAGTRGGGSRILDLTPRRPEGGITRVLLEVSRQDYTVEQTTLFDAYGNTTAVAFSNLRLNGDLPDSTFTFVPPQGVRVVRPPAR